MAVDYVYDKTKLTDDEITRLKKLRNRNSEYWKDDLFRIDIPKETGLRHDIEGAATGNFSYPIFSYKTFDNDTIDPDKKISFFDSPYTPGYTAAFVQGFGVKERNGDTEEQAKKYIDELRTKLKTAPIIAAAQLGYFQLNDGSGDSWLYNYYRNDIFNSYGTVKHSNINSEILAVGNVADLYYKHFIRNPFIYVDWSLWTSSLPRLKVSENSHVIGQIIHLYRLDLENSLWEPRWDSDVSYLNLFNSHIRFNTKNESLVVGESRIRPTPDNASSPEKFFKREFTDIGYQSGSPVITCDYSGCRDGYSGNSSIHFAYDLSEREADKPVLTLKSKVTGKTAIVFEEKALNNLKNLTYRQLIKTETDVEPDAFFLLEEYKKGRYRLFLRQCPNGFCIGVEKLAIPIPTHLVASYAQQAQAANTLFALRLNDKNSDIFDRTLPRKSLWLRVIDGHSNQWVQGKTAPVESYRKGVQLGGEVFTWQNESNQLSIGLMGGQAEQRGTFRNPDTDNLTTGNVKGFGAGVYATWHQLQDKQTGAYADSWVQYQRFRHRINTEDGTERFTSKGITASIEAGYNALLAEHFTKKGNSLRVYLQPQAQLTYLGVNGKFSDSENPHVNLLGSRQLQTRVGVQAKAQFSLYKNIAIEPFAAVNALYHNKPFGVEIDGERRVINNKTAIESQLGVAVKIKSHLTLQASFNRQTGKHHQAKQGALNLQWTF
ncbi:autotransporter outer membrane beta-barrel domain-containing protein [Neisseria meningitidis]|uniref:autotransporter outer membrane beta-barrel domain-containing protein n=1 Tax=Neisseria meningitidis TaxID=487 RepID=UPI000F45276C|nr:autotransporter outer membrane beta-barrel domain-containing protein [Neisseria meningitidis]RNK28265.1 autotransporter outer membrane beta-barrel domain-containing protein [Neisseria meningitidis]